MTGSTLSLAQSPASSAEPRLRRVLPYEDTIGDVAVAAAPSMGYELVPWQSQLLLDMGAVDSRGKWVHPRVGISVQRQQGKSVDLIVWVAVLASLAGYKVLWTDHNYSTTMEMLERFRKIFGRKPGDRVYGMPGWRDRLSDVCSQTGQEWMAFSSGGVIQFSTRTKSSRLGFSFDVVVYDEAQELRNEHTQVINPTTTSGAMHNLQLIYAGTPTRAGSPAETFRDLREQAWEGGEKADDLLWLEYGVAEVGDIWDRSRWPKVMPSLGYHADPRAIAVGMKDMDELGAAQEYLGYWLPRSAQAEAPLIGEDVWRETLIGDEEVPAVFAKVAYGVKFSADGGTVALAVAASNGAAVHVELPLCASTAGGTKRLVNWLAVRASQASAVVIDGKSGAGSLCDRLQELGVPKGYATRPTTDQAITAASLMCEAAGTGGITHVECPALDLSAATATRREIGKGGGWGFGGENSTPIEAAGLALLGLTTSKRNPKRKAKVT